MRAACSSVQLFLFHCLIENCQMVSKFIRTMGNVGKRGWGGWGGGWRKEAARGGSRLLYTVPDPTEYRIIRIIRLPYYRVLNGSIPYYTVLYGVLYGPNTV